MNVTDLFVVLLAILVGAKLLGELAEAVGQPAVLGELVAGILLGPSLLGLVPPDQPVIQLLAELGVVVLLFEIGLEMELGALLAVGGVAGVVAVVGVVTPMALGLLVMSAMDVPFLPRLVASAALTATSVGITARVFSDLGCLNEPEGRVVLSAAVFDDVLGLLILAVVSGLVASGTVDAASVLRTAAVAGAFLVIAVVAGRLVVPPLFALLDRIGREQSLATMGFALALLFAVLSDRARLAPLIGAFAAGLVLGETPQAPRIRAGIVRIGHLFVPIFFVVVGAAVDVRALLSGRVFGIGLALIAVGVAGKVVSGYGPWWFKGRKLVVGVGMIPRGEVGLIFARMGQSSGVLDPGLYAAIMMMVVVTTLGVPPVLRVLVARRGEPPQEGGGLTELATEA